MMAPKQERPSASEAGYYRRKARDADRAAETAETDEAKQFYMELAKTFYEMAARAEQNDQ